MKPLLLIVMLFATSLASAATNSRPNILWLIAEDFGPHLSCYGTKEVWTPNIDSLARQGVRYDRFYCTAPVCSASRSAFMTGMYQTTIGAQNHRSHRDDGYQLPQGVRVLTDRMRDLGYFTANVREMPDPIRFKGTGKTDWNFTYSGKSFDSDKWSELKTHQPFYAQLNFQETHRAFKAPKKADPANVELPPYYPDHEITRTDWAAYLDSATELDRKIGVVLKRLEADGLADNTVVVFFGDNGQAHVRGKQFCYEEGLHAPLMIRWPKNFPLPKHFKPGTVNSNLIEAIDLAPTMLEIANDFRVGMQGGTAPSFVGNKTPANPNGVFPGPAPTPTKGYTARQYRWGTQGVPFFGDNAGTPKQYVFGARDRCDETVFRFRTVRDARYRYIRNFTPERPFLQANEYKEKQYPVWNLIKDLSRENKLTPEQAVLAAPTMPEEELYDLQTDPWEMKNLARSAEHGEVLKRLRVELEKWITETDDKGRVLEPLELVLNKGLVHTNQNPNIGYTQDGKPPGAEARPPQKN